MIVFVPSYDDATAANFAVARDLPEARVTLAGHLATREALLAALHHHDAPLFAMAHGAPDQLIGHEDAAAITSTDAEIFRGRSAYAFACHTSARLGRELAMHGVTWWGYIKEVTAPDPREIFRHHFTAIFTSIFESFPRATSMADRDAIILDIKRHCDRVANIVDEAAEADLQLDVMETVQSLRDIWQLLQVWTSDASEAQRHPHAPLILPLS